MTKDDIGALFELLDIYFPGHPRMSAKGLRSAWLAVLEPYKREDVKAAVMAFLREKPGFPSPQEIAIKCPQPVAETGNAHAIPQPIGSMDIRAKGAQDRFHARWKKEQDRLIPLRHAAGLPATWPEAQAGGMTSREWWNALEAAGLNTPDSVWHEEAVADGTP